jgi:hypothetical protein
VSDQPSIFEDERERGIESVIEYLNRPGSHSTLMGRPFDVSKDKGKREFAEWFTDLLIEMADYADTLPTDLPDNAGDAT